MEVRTCSVTAHRGAKGHKLLVQGDGFELRFSNAVGHVKARVTDDRRLVVDGNETRVNVLNPLEDVEYGDLIAEEVDLEVVVDPDEGIEFVVGEYENLPIYSPYYGVTAGGDPYAIYTWATGGGRDEVLELTAPKGDNSVHVVENIETGWAVPMSFGEVEELFEGELSPAIEVV